MFRTALPAFVILAAASGYASAAALAIDLPAQPLSTSLRQLGEQAGLTIAADTGLLEGRNAPALKGLMEPLTALARLLSGSGLVYRQHGDTLVIAASDNSALELDTTRIQALGLGASTENTGSYTTGVITAGGKAPTRLRDTPQSVSVITRQRMEDQGLTSLTQALDQTTGITLTGGNDSKTQILSRGFALTSIQTDGGAPSVREETYQTLPDMTAYDHVEVLRGSDGLYGSTGEPGGSINLVRKRALDHNQLKLSTSAGSWNNYRTEVDVTGPLGFDGRLRGRMAMSYEDKNYFYKGADSEKHVLFGTLEADVSPDTLLTVGGTYEWRDMDGYWDGGIPRYANGDDLGLSRRTSLAADWSSNNYKRTEGFIKLEHHLNDNWSVNSSYTKVKFDTTEDIGEVTGQLDEVTLTGSSYARFIRGYTNDQDLFDANLQGQFEAFGLQHELLLGVDYSELHRSYSDHSDNTYEVNPLTTDVGSLPRPPSPAIYYYSPFWDARKSGAYATLRAHLSEPLKLIVGARYSDYSDTTRTVVPAWGSDQVVGGHDSGVVTPYGGLVYDLTEQWAAYASYAEIYKPQTSFMDTGFNTLEPITGNTYETGLKGELLDGRLNASVALYYTKREHEAVVDFYGSAPVSGNCCYSASGEVLSKGIDAEISGLLAPGWQATFGYTLNINRKRSVSDTTQNGKAYSSQTPKHLLKLFTTYQMPGDWNRWKLGLGATIQSKTYQAGYVTTREGDGSLSTDTVPFAFEQAGYAVWNGLVEYRIDEHWTAAVNANNLLDKTYYQTVYSSDNGNWYGAPRNYMLTLRGTF